MNIGDARWRLWKLLKNFIRLAKDEEGAAMVEYALLLSLVAVVSFGAVGTLGTTIGGIFSALNTVLAG